jgi:hypothetical protein
MSKLCAAKGWHTPTEYVDTDISASTELLDDLRRANDSDPADNLSAFCTRPRREARSFAGWT